MIAEATERVVLHVGAGRGKLPSDFDGWREVRYDVDAEARPDIVGDIRRLEGIEDGAFDAVYASHVIEHLHSFEVIPTLGEMRRVLRSGGRLELRCPDLEAVAQMIVSDGLAATAYTSRAGRVTPLDMLYGHVQQVADGKAYMAHKTGFTAETLRHVLKSSGYASATINRRGFELLAFATR